MTFLILFVALTAGNFAYAFPKRRWEVALERSYFQGAALLVAWLIHR